MNKRKIVLGLLFVMSAWLAFFGDKTPSPDVITTSTSATTATTVPAPRTSANIASQTDIPILELVSRQEWELSTSSERSSAKDLFALHSWAPSAPKPAAVAPVVLTAPPLSYSYVGKKKQSDIWEVYLSKGEQIMIVREGETLDLLYKVQKIQPPSLTLVYLPLNQTQTIVIGQWE